MNNSNKNTLDKIVSEINSAVIDFIEGKDGVGKLQERLSKFDSWDVLKKLNDSDFGVLVILIEEGSKFDWYTSQSEYNPKDPNSVQQLFEKYYKEIKSGKKPNESSIKHNVEFED